MTRDDIIRMAQDAWVLPDAHIPNVLEFASLVAAAEREACAKVVEEWLHGEWHNQGVVATTMIRARGQV
jgi:hypothetical protein